MKELNIQKLKKIEMIQKEIFQNNKDYILNKYKNLHKIMNKNFQVFLNNFHNKTYSKKQWQILIGPWLDHIIQIYIINFIILKKKKFINYKKVLNVNFSKSKKFLVSGDFNEFVEHVYSDQLHELFLRELKYENNDFFYKISKIKKKYTLKSRLYNFIIQLYKFLPSRILISRFKVNNFIKLKLLMKSYFKICFFPSFESISTVENLSLMKRNLNFDHLQLKKKKIFLQLIKFIPSCYLENFKEYESFSKKYYKNFDTIISDATYLSDEILKINIIKNLNKKKIKIFIEQHGGNFDLFQSEFSNFHEKKISDIFISWGINKKINLSRPPPSRLSFLKNFNQKSVIHEYNFCVILPSLKKLSYFPHLRENFKTEVYFDQFINFLKKNNLFSKIVFKAYVEKRYFNQLNLNDLSKIYKIKKNKIYSSNSIIVSSKILVFNYMSTMIFEAIIVNKPFIIIYPIKYARISEHGNKLFKKFEGMNIFFKNFEESQEVLKNPSRYCKEWFSKHKQKKINSMRSSILQNETSTNNFVDQWLRFINQN